MNESLAPQDLYRKARTIDWLTFNSNNARTGKIGEELVFNLEKHFLNVINREDLAEAIRYQEDGAGYDILSYFSDGRNKYIEVKTTIYDLEAPYVISRDEIEFLARNSDNAFLYRVALSGKDTPPRLKVYTYNDVLAAKSRAKSFIIKH